VGVAVRVSVYEYGRLFLCRVLMVFLQTLASLLPPRSSRSSRTSRSSTLDLLPVLHPSVDLHVTARLKLEHFESLMKWNRSQRRVNTFKEVITGNYLTLRQITVFSSRRLLNACSTRHRRVCPRNCTRTCFTRTCGSTPCCSSTQVRFLLFFLSSVLLSVARRRPRSGEPELHDLPRLAQICPLPLSRISFYSLPPLFRKAFSYNFNILASSSGSK
jgi:hypothetical protein